jgi:hypothetical protein
MSHNRQESFPRQVWSGGLKGGYHHLGSPNAHEIEGRRLFLREHILEECRPPLHFRIRWQVSDCRWRDIPVGAGRYADSGGQSERIYGGLADQNCLIAKFCKGTDYRSTWFGIEHEKDCVGSYLGNSESLLRSVRLFRAYLEVDDRTKIALFEVGNERIVAGSSPGVVLRDYCDLLGTVIDGILELSFAFDRCRQLGGINVLADRIRYAVGDRGDIDKGDLLSISERAARVAFEQPPPRSANALCADTRVRIAATAVSGSQRSSSRMRMSLRP